MMLRDTGDRFGVVSRGFHWVIAVLTIALIGLGYYMVDLTYEDTWRDQSVALHISLGMIALGLAFASLAWRLYSPAAGLPARLDAARRRSANATHRVLLTLTLAMPVTGYAISSSAGHDIFVFDWFDIPALLERNRTVCFWAIKLHFYICYAAIPLIAFHAVAAVKRKSRYRLAAAGETHPIRPGLPG